MAESWRTPGQLKSVGQSRMPGIWLAGVGRWDKRGVGGSFLFYFCSASICRESRNASDLILDVVFFTACTTLGTKFHIFIRPPLPPPRSSLASCLDVKLRCEYHDGLDHHS